MTPERPTVFLVDDDTGVLKSLSRLLRASGWEARSFVSPRAFLEGLTQDCWGCLVLDVAMPGLDGLELQQLLGESSVLLPIVFLTGHGDVRMSVQAMRSGAIHFLTKPVDADHLLAAIEEAVEKGRVARVEHAERMAVLARLAALTPREREVLALVVQGLLNKQIAAQLGAAEKTIKIHRARVMDKMGAHSVAELVRAVERLSISSRVMQKSVNDSRSSLS